MKTKRVFFALMAMLLLPLSVMAQTPTPAPGTAVIAVSVFFDNGNTGDPVTVKLQCTGGTIAPTDVKVLDPKFGNRTHAFVVESIPLDPEAEEPGVDCWVTQDPLDGYDTYYDCLPGEVDGANPDPACANVLSDDFCHWTDVQPDDVAECDVFNNVEYQDVEVVKQWDISGTGGDETSLYARIYTVCNTYMAGGSDIGSGYWRTVKYLYDNDYDADGAAVVTSKVKPLWYPEDSSSGNICYAYESGTASSVEVDDSDCDEMEVFVGSGDGCTIINTVFFEGIPTLNQYGLAIMALLMLGVGFVGFRRFV